MVEAIFFVTEKRTKTSLKEDCKIAWDMTSDGCSMSPDLAHKDCCDEHDHAYRNPPALTGVSRLQADNRLFKCMMKKYKTPIFPIIYWLGVRIGGCTAWRWGKKWTTDEEAEHQRLFGDEDI